MHGWAADGFYVASNLSQRNWVWCVLKHQALINTGYAPQGGCYSVRWWVWLWVTLTSLLPPWFLSPLHSSYPPGCQRSLQEPGKGVTLVPSLCVACHLLDLGSCTPGGVLKTYFSVWRNLALRFGEAGRTKLWNHVCAACVSVWLFAFARKALLWIQPPPPPPKFFSLSLSLQASKHLIWNMPKFKFITYGNHIWICKALRK